ncbi:hypothetical protein HETIRDRAFT_157067 [Heterobasidion irregulare TC 32-1]|uniref:PH domain-containing protein n=1 Tax=Heterobasidion irregulare (strain TC 32-1) TaxID=747525 RepID=W4KC76_HETIT|nr:uncharacterized protein HETIRDRAFT_157067 [Heterobasidion irregulare TC 32-1]ETW83329.1 hypothetical protein HETIRDRAFT_157067 [Heterobasidion irregulare TC 32-1]
MSHPVAPPTPQEVIRKLSIHSAAKPKITPPAGGLVSGTESDSDSVFSPDHASPSAHAASVSGSSSAPPPLSAIVERRGPAGGEDSEDDEDDNDAPFMAGDGDGDGDGPHKAGESDLRAGYLWKKGERRKNWKRRWFVLRPAHLAYYKTSAEYQLHRLLDLHEVHTCTPVSLKKHENTFGVVSAARTFYLQAETQEEMQAWVSALKDAKEALLATSTTTSLNAGTGAPAPPQPPPPPHGHGHGHGHTHAAPAPIPIPMARSRDVFHHAHAHAPAPVPPSPPSHGYRGGSGGGITSSDSEDGGLSSSPTSMPFSTSPSGQPAATATATATAKDASKATVIAGYIMKCGSKRRNWRKRWFVLNGEKLMYSGSHMDTKPHRQIPLSQILDAFEYDLPQHRAAPGQLGTGPSSVPAAVPRGAGDDVDGAHGKQTFKIVTTKRTLLLCAPSEEEEIRWLSAVRALIARRQDAGVVPGEKDKGSSKGPPVGGSEVGSHAAFVVGSGSGSGSGTKNRKDLGVTAGSVAEGAVSERP